LPLGVTEKTMKKRIVNIFLVLTSIFLALALCEVGLWFLGIEYPNFWDFDPVLGSKLRPGAQGYWLQEGGGYVSINSDGLRDREHALDKPPNTLRIAVLGDSYTEALQVNREDAFWAVMEKDLNKCKNLGHRQVEVINFGQSGFGTTLELLALRHRVWKYSPDAVLLAFIYNDVSDNFKPLAIQFNGSLSDFTPYHFYKNGKLILVDRLKEFKNQWEELPTADSTWFPFQQWLTNSRMFHLVRHCQKIVWTQSKAESIPYDNKPIFRQPTDEHWEEAWRITEDVLLLMRDEIAQRGVKFFVVVLTHPIQVYPDPEFRDQYAKKIGVKNLSYLDRRLEKFCQRVGIPILFLAPTFQEYADKHRVYLHGFKNTLGFGGNLGEGHWNQTAHHLAGNLIAEWLCEQIN